MKGKGSPVPFYFLQIINHQAKIVIVRKPPWINDKEKSLIYIIVINLQLKATCQYMYYCNDEVIVGKYNCR